MYAKQETAFQSALSIGINVSQLKQTDVGLELIYFKTIKIKYYNKILDKTIDM